jgi:hypothetical protein
MMTADYFVGLDLGQVSDFTALAVLERPALTLEPRAKREPLYCLRHLQRFPLGTPYPALAAAVAQLVDLPPLQDSCTVVVDQTGIGRPIVDMLRQARVFGPIVPITLTGGHAVTEAPDGSRHVPKKELVACLQLLLQGRRLKVARDLPEASLLLQELANFRVKITAAANETFGAWRDGEHDDLVLAVALASWEAERQTHCSLDWGREADNWATRPPNDVFLTGRDEDATHPDW